MMAFLWVFSNKINKYAAGSGSSRQILSLVHSLRPNSQITEPYPFHRPLSLRRVNLLLCLFSLSIYFLY
ncbi:hypothetical protein RIF29_41767 [Crotalaria pallida]|uniref:Uncharacterized protein n=1 Tax=Crotalaria pallida TaxID=3830 RepID=A0AAN9E7Z1_CROPI